MTDLMDTICVIFGDVNGTLRRAIDERTIADLDFEPEATDD